MIDCDGKQLVKGDFVVTTRYGSGGEFGPYFRIVELQDVWALDQWAAVVESVTNNKFRATIDCHRLKKVDDDTAMIIMLEI